MKLNIKNICRKKNWKHTKSIRTTRSYTCFFFPFLFLALFPDVGIGFGVLDTLEILPLFPPDDDLHVGGCFALCAVALAGGLPFCPFDGVFSRCLIWPLLPSAGLFRAFICDGIKKDLHKQKKNSLLFAFQINIWNAQKVIIKWMWNTKKKLNKEN